MKHIDLIGLCVVVTLAINVSIVASASATEVLFSSTTGSLKATGGAAKLNGASEISCTSTTVSGTIETAHLGKIKITFEKCTTQLLGSHECTGTKPVSSTKGDIISEGTFHLGTARKVSTESAHAALLVLVNTTELECTGVGVVKVTGSVIGLLQTKAGAALVPEEPFLHSVVAFQGSGKTQSHKEFILLLTTPPEQLMTKQELESEIFGIKGESSLISSFEITETTPAGLYLCG